MIAAAALLAARPPEPQDTALASFEPPTVTVAQAVETVVLATVSVAGTIIPRNEVLVTPQIGGGDVASWSAPSGDKG